MKFPNFLLNTKYCLSLALAGSLLTSPLSTLAAPYTLADLEFLTVEKNVEEFFQHYLDIRPAERKERWKELVQTMSIEWLNRLMREKNLERATLKEINKRSELYPFRDDEHFIFKKNQYLQLYFDDCFQKQDPKQAKSCNEDLRFSLSLSIRDSEWAYQFLKKHQKRLGPDELLSLFQIIFKSSDAMVFCQKADLAQWAIKKISEDKVRNTKKAERVENYISKSCAVKMYEVSKEQLFEGKRLNRLDLYEYFKSMNLIQKPDEQLFFIIFTLDSPEIGDTLNLAWNFIQSLAENYPLRMQMMERMKKLKTLPGETVFQGPSYDRHMAIIKLFKANFPEYLDYYAENCLKTLNGPSEGLPVVKSCHEFLQLKEIDSKWREQYQGLKKSVEGLKK